MAEDREKPVVLVVVLTVRPSKEALFQAFEEAAFRIMARYGGAVERAVVVPAPIAGEAMREVHVVRFPGAAAFAEYRADAELAGLASMRAEAIVATEILVGHDREPPLGGASGAIEGGANR